MDRMIKRFLIAVLILSGCFLTGCTAQKRADFSRIKRIAELATYECYYHNVAEFEEPGHNFLIKYGNKKVWIEYTGIVKIGIDASKIVINETENSVVEVSLPSSEIIDSSIVKNSIREPLIENGIFAAITAEDKVEAMAAAQKNMIETASRDYSLIEQSNERAKVLIENFIKAVGEDVGKEYHVKWIALE